MIRNYRYAVISLLAAVLFTFGSIVSMNYILRVRETRLLTEKGRLEVESPVREWEGWGNGNGNNGSGDTESERYSLDMEQIEEAVSSWNSRTEVILHDRVAGQISMEKAIENGKIWLAEMKIGDNPDMTSVSINAELGVSGQGREAKEQMEAYFSFWTVTYLNQSMRAVLYLNAVTGKVWGAEISLYGELPEQWPGNRLPLFSELAGLQCDTDLAAVDSGETWTEIAIKGSRMFAQEQIYSMSIGFENSYKYISYRLLVK